MENKNNNNNIDSEPTNREILEAIKVFSGEMDHKMANLGTGLQSQINEIKLNMATKDDVRKIVKEEIKVVTNQMDAFMKKTEAVKQEQLANTNILKRLSDETEQNTIDIKLIKPLVGLS